MAENVDWQKRFAGAPNWSSYGIVDDGVTDNTAALNALPSIPLIGDCPHGGKVFYSGVWFWKSNHQIWYNHGCKLVYGETIPGIYPITSAGGLKAIAPINGVYDYGLQISALIPVSTVRVMQVWATNLDMEHFDINGTGGFLFNGGSNQFYALGVIRNTVPRVGNPCFRFTHTYPKVPTSLGHRNSVEVRNVNATCGDAVFQACQPTPTPGVWTYNQDDIDQGFYDSYGFSYQSTAMLVNLQSSGPTNYACNHIVYSNLVLGGFEEAIVVPGGVYSQTDDVEMDTINFTGGPSSSAGKAAIGVGNVTRGPFTFIGQMGRVFMRRMTTSGTLATDLEIVGPNTGLVVDNSSFGPPSANTFPTAVIRGTSTGSITNTSFVAGLGDALQIGQTGQATNLSGSVLTFSGVGNGYAGLRLGGDADVNFMGGSVTPAPGAKTATGISLATDPQGAHGAHVSGFDLSAMPVKINCAPGQGNVVVKNPGAPDCLP